MRYQWLGLSKVQLSSTWQFDLILWLNIALELGRPIDEPERSPQSASIENGHIAIIAAGLGSINLGSCARMCICGVFRRPKHLECTPEEPKKTPHQDEPGKVFRRPRNTRLRQRWDWAQAGSNSGDSLHLTCRRSLPVCTSEAMPGISSHTERKKN